ncbi:MAG: nucleotidyltransferase family protein [Alphaproteobacteria bacterium]
MATNTLVPPELLDPVVAYFNPRRIILFGSTARGEASADSDIDLLVILDDDTPPERLTLRAGWEARQSYNQGPADVIPCREATFETKRQIAGTLPYEAACEGIVVYERG